MPKMHEDELKSIVDAEIHQSIGYITDELSSDRIDGWDAYLKESYGNEIEGRSHVVSSDVQDTVEWILPSLVRIFTQAENSVEFAPHGVEDEPAAKQATDYCNYVWNRDNDGFLNFYTWFKDALIAKVAWVKIYWEKEDSWERETYYDLDEDSFALIVGDEDKEIIEHSEYQSDMGISHDVTVKWKEDAGKICVDPVPSDEVIFSQDAKNVQDCRFVGHRKRWYMTDLLEAFPNKKKVILDLSTDAPGGHELEEAQSRSTVQEEDEWQTQDASVLNKAMRQVWVTECYIRVDYDGDDIAEMRKVTVAGTGTTILDNEEWHGPRPLAALCPVLMPHRLVGLSIPDLIKDLQLIKTTVLRQYLDALYLGTNPRMEVKDEYIRDPAEVLTSKPGGIVRTGGPPGAPAIMPIQQPDVSSVALEGLNYIDQLRENRTGVSPRTTGLGENSLHETATGEQLLYSAAQSRVELIARVFAETGVKDAFRLILWIANKYQDKDRVIKLRNEWVPMKPSDWKANYDMTVNVGLGNGDKSRDLAAINMIAERQIQALQFQGGADGPLVNMMNLYNTASKFVEAAGLKGTDLYFSDPSKQPPKPEKPTEAQQEMQAKMELEKMKAQIAGQVNMQKAQTQAELDRAKAELQAQLDMKKAEQQQSIEAIQAQADIAVDRQEAQIKIALEKQKAEFEMLMMEREAKLDAQLEILKAHLKYAGEVAGVKMKENEMGELSPDSGKDEADEAVKQAVDGMRDAVSAMTEVMSRPKKVIRDKQGRVAGVQ